MISFQAGIYFFTLVDYFAAGVSLMYIAFFEVIAVVWFYGNTRYTDDLATNQFFICIGAKRLVRNVKEMTGKEPHIFIIICWYAVAPSLILVRAFTAR